jgi:hypothetical protein
VLADKPIKDAVVAVSAGEVPDTEEGYVLAYEQDDICASIMDHLVAEGKMYFPCVRYNPVAEYWRTNVTAQAVLELEYDLQTAKQDHKWNTPDFVNITQAIEVTRDVPGDYVEVGVFRGNSARVALRYMDRRAMQRECWFLDVFVGFNYAEARTSVDRLWEGSHVAGTPEAMLDDLQSCLSADSRLGLHVEKCNIISDALPALGEIAVANLDVDMYEAVSAGLFRLAPRIADGGILIVEDRGHTPALSGAFHALTEFLRDDLGELFMPLAMESGQTFLIKMSEKRGGPTL